MGRRSDHTRQELHALALAAARDIAESQGVAGLTARAVARRIGYSVGTLYNLFEDFDDLMMHLNGATLDALYDALAGLPSEEEPEAALLGIAHGYIAFVGAHPSLWGLLFDPRLPPAGELPEWHYEKVLRLLGLVEQALAPLFASDAEDERRHSARVLQASLHGICSLEVTGRLAVTETVLGLTHSMITNYVAGLRARITEAA